MTSADPGEADETAKAGRCWAVEEYAQQYE